MSKILLIRWSSAMLRFETNRYAGHNGHGSEICQQFKTVRAKAGKQQNQNSKREQCAVA